MPMLSRRRAAKRKASEANAPLQPSSTEESTEVSASSTDIEEVEQMRTDDTSRQSTTANVLADISTIGNLDKSQTQSRRSQANLRSVSQPLDDESEPMDAITQCEHNDEQSAQWGDDMNLSIGPTETQAAREARNLSNEEERSAALNVAQCGTIESITLHNFMCHSNFHLELGPRINFIVGRNGSGKSAILTAIVLGFGGRAATTSRGKGIASFIKSGETQAKIILKICNKDETGKQGFRYEDFGHSIIIERTINSSGASTYKIKAANGKVVAERKDVLEGIIRYFNVQVDNPVCVLNQEVSRNFLNTKNARDKYTFFMKATLLEDMKNKYAAADNDRSASVEQLAVKQKVLPETAKELKHLEQKVKMFNELENSKDKFIQLNNEALWAIVNEDRQKVADVKAKLEECAKRVEEETLKLEKVNQEVEKLTQEQKQALERLNGFVKEVETMRKTVEESKAKCEEIRDKIRDKEKDERAVKLELNANQKDIKSLEEKIERLSREYSDESYNNRKLEIERLKSDIQKFREEEQNIKGNEQDLNESIHQMTDEKIKLSQEDRRLMSVIDDRKRNIERIDGCRSQRLQRFGAKHAELVKKIEEFNRKGEFKHKPLGPIGNHIQLRDSSCALAVELCLKKTLFAYCCHDSSDAIKLHELMRRVFGNDRLPQIITRPFVSLHDVSRYKVVSDRYRSFLDLMVIKEAPIANALIDQLKVESILYIPDYREAQNLLMDPHSVPANCQMAYTEDGCTMYPQTNNSDYKQYAPFDGKKSAQYLMKNVDQMINQLREEVNLVSAEMKRNKENLADCTRVLEAKTREMQALEARKRKVRNDMFGSDAKLKQLEAIGDSAPIEVSTLEEELDNHNTKNTELMTRFETIVAEKDGLLTVQAEVEDEYRTKRGEYEHLMGERQPLKDSLEKTKTDLQKHELVRAKYEKVKNDALQVQQHEERRLAHEEEELKQNEATALSKTETPIETKRTSNAVTNEIKQLERFMNEQENVIGNKKEIYDKYQTVLTHYRQVKRQVTKLESLLQRLHISLQLRKRAFTEFRNYVTMMTKINFGAILSNKNFSGSLEVFHHSKEVNGEQKKAKTLEIKVNPKGDEQENCNSQQSVISSYSDTRSLSGGERSFSTVAFILALWESAHSPFKILDEVDVFMDLVTRQISLDAMIEFAATKSGKQYIFLSPLKIQKLINPELIQIFQMPEPVRTQ